MVRANAALRELAEGEPAAMLDTDRLRAAGMTWEDVPSLVGSKLPRARLWEALIPVMGTSPGRGGAVVAVLAPNHGALVALDAVRINGDAGTARDFDVEDGTLTVIPRTGNLPPTRAEYHWTGTHFARSQ